MHIADGEDFGAFAFSSRTAAMVSAVSPDWLMAMTRVPGGTIGIFIAKFRGDFDLDRNARQIFQHVSCEYPACHEVPQARMRIAARPRVRSHRSSIPSKSAVP